MLLPAVILVFIYSYLPIVGNAIAFMKFDIYKGVAAFWQSEWVGLQNYRDLISMGDPIHVLINTVIISVLKIAFGLLVPIIVALLLNEVRRSKVKRTLQTVVYMPNFLSWVILAGILKQVLSSEGILNNLIASLGGGKIPFLQSNAWFVPMLVATDVWKNFGFNTIVYLAAITGIDPTYYEAAIVDGAGRWKQTLHVTLPGMMSIIVLTAVLSLQGVLNAGFDQVFNLYSPQVYETGDIIDTFVYRISFQSTTPLYDQATAIGLFKSAVSLVLISLSYWLAYRWANYQIF
jgi:putative aldouronate transport system permease protein